MEGSYTNIGHQFLAFVGARGRPAQPLIHHACLTVEDFDPERILKTLEAFGVKPRGDRRAPTRPLESYVTMRMPNRGGAADGTPELYFTDPDGILLQIQDVRYRGGSGYLGDQRGQEENREEPSWGIGGKRSRLFHGLTRHPQHHSARQQR